MTSNGTLIISHGKLTGGSAPTLTKANIIDSIYNRADLKRPKATKTTKAIMEEIMRRGFYLPIFLAFFSTCLLLCTSSAKAQGPAIDLTSPAFDHGSMIPSKYTCDGVNVSPSLDWSSIPNGTKSFVIICDDPDAPMGTWVHWVYYDIPAEAKGLPENVGTLEHPQCGGTQGRSDFGSIGYGGPCPPSGTHRYFFKSYALDVRLDLAPGATKSEVLKSMNGHILEQLKLMGRYKRLF